MEGVNLKDQVKSFINKSKEKQRQSPERMSVFDKLLKISDPDKRELSSSSSSGDSELENVDLLTPAKLIKH